jgi:hypothetical protein
MQLAYMQARLHTNTPARKHAITLHAKTLPFKQAFSQGRLHAITIPRMQAITQECRTQARLQARPQTRK